MALLHGLLLLLGLISFGRCQDTCTFSDLCVQLKTINQPCGFGIFAPCRSVSLQRPCLQTEPCTSVFDTWSPCSVTCDTGTRTRIGRCCSPSCSKVVTESEDCDSGIRCETVDGNWSSWSAWTDTTACTASCCGGTKDRTRSRTCTNPAPTPGAMTCPGDATETETVDCNTQDCPVTCVADEFQPSPCEFCIAEHYECNGGVPEARVCDGALVWSVGFNACVPAAICSPPAS